MPETVGTGVHPSNEIQFGVCMDGRPSDLKTAEYTVVKDAESLSISIDNGIEEWNPMDAEGWGRALTTAKSLSISMGGKRNYGDAGNDFVAGLAWANGQECNSAMKVTFPNQDILYVPCVISTNALGGDSTGIDSLEWEVKSDGKPLYVSYPTA